MNSRIWISRILMVSICLPWFSGCATILSQRSYPVAVDNSGGQTYFTVHDEKQNLVHEGVTPSQVDLDAKSRPFWPAKYDVTFVGSDDAVQHRQIKAGFDPWLLGNVVTGGLIGVAVDGASGAMFKLPKQVNGDIPEQSVLADRDLGAQIAANHVESRRTDRATQAGVEPEDVVERVAFEDETGTITR